METVSKLNWFVFYTFPRAEKVVCRELMNLNYEVFLPMTKTMRVWKNRQKKWIDQVLFPGYIFVNTIPSELYNITQLPRIVSYLQFAGKPSILPIKEVESIKRILSLKQDILVDTKFYKGDKVKIIHGPLTGYEGVLIEQNGKARFGIMLKEIHHTLLIDISINVLERYCNS